MATWDPPWLRPLLGVRRADTAAACAAQGLAVWDDPHNADPRFTRVRLRHEVLPLLEEVLGGGVAEALARTAAQLREDAEVLDAVAGELLARASADRDAQDGVPERATRGEEGLDAALAARPPRSAGGCCAPGCAPRRHRAHRPPPAGGRRPRGRWPGQGAVVLPRRLELVREHGKLGAHGGVAGRSMRSGPGVRRDRRRRPPRPRRTHRVRR